MSQWKKIGEWLGRRMGEVPTLSVGDTARMLEEAKTMKDDLALLIADLEAHQRKLVGAGSRLVAETSDGELVRVTTSAPKPRWIYDDDADVLDLVVARAVDQRRADPETGEMLEREADAVARGIATVWQLSASKARIGKKATPLEPASGLAALGIDIKQIRAKAPSV